MILISDEQIIELSRDYASAQINAKKDDFSYLRDCCYYACGFVVLRSFGFSYEDARTRFIAASQVDGYYPNNLPVFDNDVITIATRFIDRYKAIGRYQRQDRVENSRDLIYWTIFCLNSRIGSNQESALRHMENAMNHEAGLPDVYAADPKPPVKSLTTKGRLICAENEPIILKEVTAFNLCDLFAKGQNIDSFLEEFKEANTLRIFWYTPRKDWKENAWDLPTANQLIAFHEYVANFGFYVENVCITDDDASKLPAIKDLIYNLKISGLVNILFEAVNEPYVHDKLEPSVLKNALTNTPYLYTSGYTDGQDESKFYGKYITTHTGRDAEGPRKAKDLEELGSKYLIPSTANEPFRPDQGFSPLDFYTYAALSNLMGNGACFHYLDGEFSKLPQGHDKECADMFFKGFSVFPADACLGSYEHIRSLEKIVIINGEEVPTAALRVFRKGSYVVIVRNKSVDIPSNWVSLDEFGVAYKIQ
jgi:hypothetical protein